MALKADFGCRLLEVDFCTAPEAKILLTDLTWVRADVVQVGAELIAFDEMPKGHQHSFRAARVLAVKHLRRPRVLVRTSHGTTIVSTEHPLLARSHKLARRWVRAADLRPGMQLAFLAGPWEPDTSWDGGWLAGFFDGEGWVSSVKVGYAQNTGPTLDRAEALLTERAFEFWRCNSNSTAQCAITNGLRETLRFLGVIRPTRLLRKSRGIWEGRRTWGKQSPICRVLSVEPLEEGPVVALETTTKTYISDGFFSHNCAIEAKLTGWLCQHAEFMRLAALGVHGALVTHLTGNPYDPTQSDADLKACFKVAKQANPLIYDRAKHCLTGDHEVLTPTGWVRLDAYVEGSAVLQWDPDGTLTFTVPQQVVRTPFSGTLIDCLGRSLSAVMTPDHRIPMKYGASSPWAVKTAGTLPSQGRIPCGGILAGHEEIAPDFLRLIVAVQADATVGSGGAVFTLVKPRKIQRLRALLDRLQIAYTDVPSTGRAGGRRIRVPEATATLVCAWLEGREKYFHLPAFLGLTAACREVVLEELQYWDGHTNPKGGYTYFTSHRRQAEYVQTLAATVGRQALLRIQRPSKNRYGTSPQCAVSFNGRAFARIEALVQTPQPFTGTVYCLSVPSSFFLIRHRDRISVTGNCVYGDLYGQTEYGMMQSFPAEFPTLKVAKEYKRVLHAMAPTVPQFQQDVRQIAYDLNYLGGPTPPAVYSNEVAKVFARNPNLKQHPFGYKHWFWSILGFRKIPYNVYLKRQKAGEPVTVIQGDYCAITLGADAKRVVAFMPQSIAAGILKEALLRLFTPGLPHYIGTAYYGRTPLRAPIHDSGLFEVPVRVWDRVLEAVVTEFTRPVPQLRLDWMRAEDKARMGLGECLSIGVAAKAGPDWGSMEEIHLSAGVGELAAERVKFAEEAGEAEEDACDLGTVA